MKVKVKKTHHEAVLPFKTYNEDFCYDVVATTCEQVAPNVYKYGIGLAFEIDNANYHPQYAMWINWGRKGHFKHQDFQLSIDLRPRSSVWKTGMVLSNCIGTIDQLYRGEVSAVFYHIFPEMPKYQIGDKIGQIKLGLTLPIEFMETEELTATERGAKGYGSTGK